MAKKVFTDESLNTFVEEVKAYTDNAVSGKADSSHGTHVSYGTSATAVAPSASAGTASTVSRSDHVHSLPVASSTLGGVKTTSTVSSTSGLTACPIISGVPYYKDTDNDTHYTSKNVIGTSATTTSNASGSEEYTDHFYLNHVENGSVTSSHKLVGQQIKMAWDGEALNIAPTLPFANETIGGMMSADDKVKLDVTNVTYGTCSTAAATAAKVVTTTGNTKWKLASGSIVTVLFSDTNTAENPTLNVNGTGEKNIYYGSSQITTSNLGYAGTANRPMTFVYDGTQYRFSGWGYDSNTTYTNVKLGHGYCTCSTAAATVAKTASLSSYTLTTGGIVAVKFTYDVPAGATLNINSKGAKAIYHKGAAITAGVIKAGDTATFIYSSQYHLISLNRDTTYSNFVKSGSGAAAGLVPAPSTTAGTTKYLREDGTWAIPPDTNTTYTSLKNPYSLTIQGNGTTLTNGIYDGSAAKTVNITPSSIGAAKSDHTHTGYVDTSSDQTVSGVKTFSNGLQIGNAKLTYDSTAGALKISFVGGE